jgi:phosphoribosyl 1,2-cyclic phosphodiesterase
MFLKIYGARGSIPVSGTAYTKYGGNTTCLYIENSAGNSIIVDAGSGIRDLGPFLIKNEKFDLTLIFTHYHWDHIQGFPFFGPAYFKNTVMTIYGPTRESNARKTLSYQMTKPYFPTISLNDMPARFVFKELKSNQKINRLTVRAIFNNHPNETRGLKFIENGKAIVSLSDNELAAPKKQTNYIKFVQFVKNADVMIHDAAYTDDTYKTHVGWGHSTFAQVVQLARDGGVQRVIFTHHDHTSSDQFIDNQVKRIADSNPDIRVEAAFEGMEISI